MAGFCTLCGKSIKDGKCLNGHAASTYKQGLASQDPTQPIVLPKANIFRRLLGSGVEFIVYIFAIPAMNIGFFGPGCFVLLIVLALVLLRDFNAGHFNIAKRVSQMRVVQWQSGQAASNVKSFLRNSYYLVLFAIAYVPFFGWIPLAFVITLDIMMIIANPRGRRLGDLLAGTQVVEERG